MLTLLKKKKKNKNKISFNSNLGNINIFFIDKKIKIPLNINIYKKEKNIFFKGPFGILLFDLSKLNNLNLYKFKNSLILLLDIKKNKKSILNLYIQLFIIKLKGISKNFKVHLLLKGIGFKAIIIEKNLLQLKIGFSHTVNIKIPKQVQILNHTNFLICNSNDLIFLTQFIDTIRKIKKPEPYKGKGILLKTEKILLKEGKKSKK